MRGVGRAFTIMVKQYPKPDAYHNWPHSYGWWFGTAYEYGMLPPRYPVPALRYEVEWTPEYGGNIRIYDKPDHFWIWYDDLID